MPRGLRIELPGEISHVVARGVQQSAIYRSDADRRRFMQLMREVAVGHGWRYLTYCLMGNHYHLVIQLRRPTLSAGMQKLNGAYARFFNDRYDRQGHLFESRFWSKPVRHEAHMIALARYVALNPVRSQLCTTAEQWKWSAHRALLGAEPPGFVDVPAMLAHFDTDPARARLRYAAVIAGIDPVRPDVEVGLVETLAWPDADQAVAYARALGHGVDQIARTLGCTPRTVERRLARVRAATSKGSNVKGV